MEKKRILFHTENRSLNTGYSIYCKNILEYLYNTGKYELAEFSIYCAPEDPSIPSIPWKVYPIIPSVNDNIGHQNFSTSHLNQFGFNAFNDVVIDFKPDIVCSIFDYWYSSYILKSPMRDHFKLVWMPTVDSYPQKPSWIDSYSECDKILAYSFFGKQVLETESGGKIKNVAVASPAVEDDFVPNETKSVLKEAMNIPSDSKIAMMVSRNQIRKLFPDVIDSFATHIKDSGSNNSYLYLHTTNPDGGYDLDTCIANSKISNRILVTYICGDCGAIRSCTYKGIAATCPKCSSEKMTMPSVSNSLSRQNLANIMSMADLGILAAIGEGWGMSISEFKKLGIPVASVEYSAMEEQVIDCGYEEHRYLGGIPIRVERFYIESSTQQKRALFDKDCLAGIISDVFCPDPVEIFNYNGVGDDAKKCANDYFTWDRTSKIWMEQIDSIDLSDSASWNMEMSILPEPDKEKIPQEIRNDIEALVRWCIEMWYPHRFFTEFRINEIIYSIRCGKDMIEQYNKGEYTFDKFFDYLKSLVAEHNHFESVRMPDIKEEEAKEGKLDLVII